MWRHIFLALACAAPTVLPAQEVNLNAGLVACYPFSGNAVDETGNANNGTVNGAVSTNDRFGQPNRAYQFNGNGHIRLPASQMLGGRYSYSVWASNQAIISDGESAVVLSIGDASSGVHQTVNANNDYINRVTGWSVGGYNNGTPRVTTVQTKVPTNADWVHIVSVRDDNSLKMYLNGQLFATGSTSGTVPDYGANSAAIIGMRCNLTQPFRGIIDDMAIYNRALSASEVLALYTNGLPCIEAPSIRASDAFRCGAGSVMLTASGAGSYRWYSQAQGGSPIHTGSPFTTPTLSASTTYYVAGVNGSLEGPRVKATATIAPLPQLTCSFARDVPALEPAKLAVQIAAGTPPFTYNWDFGDGNTMTTGLPEASHVFGEDGLYTVSVSVSDKNGCEAECSSKVETLFNLLIPNVFTPNRTDSDNELFSIYDADTKRIYAGRKPFEMRIFNRWGRQVNVTNDALAGWNGGNCTDGIYFYHIRFGSQEYKGWVHLRR